jgi:hypothetical protein
MSQESWIFVCAAISAIGDFLAILSRFGVFTKSGGEEATVTLQAPPKRNWASPVVLLVLTLGLCGYGFYRVNELQEHVVELQKQLASKQHFSPILMGYGGQGPQCTAIINVGPILQYKDSHNVLVVCGFTDATVDKQEDQRITVSHPYTITPENISIVTPFGPSMMSVAKQFKNGQMVSVWYQVILLPKGTGAENIHKLSDVPRNGGMVP